MGFYHKGSIHPFTQESFDTRYNALMAKSSLNLAIFEIIEIKGTGATITFEETRQLEFYVSNGHWENLPANAAFLELAPEGKVQTLVKALENRVTDLRSRLTPLGRTEKTRAAYIQILNRIHEFERLKEEILNKFYTGGKRQIAKESKGKKINFY